MATKFIQLEEAAKLLGIAPDALNEMRERNEVRGFRDGTNWKFKSEDLDRVKEDMASGGSEVNLGDEAPGEGGDSVLLSERELGGSEVIGSSTIIGEPSGEGGGDSDLSLGEGDFGGSDVELIGDSMVKGSDVKLAANSDGIDDAGSEIALDAVTPDAGSDLELSFEEDSSLDLDLDDDDLTNAGTSIGDDLSLAGTSDLSLGDAEELTLGEGGSDAGSEIDEGGSRIDLIEDDDDLVLGGTGSDVIGASDSGISLADPADSGLSLESEPLELGGSAIGDESLVLGEDDMISLGDDSDLGAATQLKSEDDFLLTPLDDAGGDDSESGSQVIALDDASLGFDQSAATLLDEGGSAAMAMLEEDLSEADTMIGIGGAAAIVGGAAQVSPGAVMMPAIPDAPYSIWNVLSMLVCIIVLCFGGMLIYDVVRQIWSWEGAHPISSGLMDTFINMFS